MRQNEIISTDQVDGFAFKTAFGSVLTSKVNPMRFFSYSLTFRVQRYVLTNNSLGVIKLQP
jgi:hypothetical protein